MQPGLDQVSRELRRFNSSQLLWPRFQGELEIGYQNEMDAQRLKLLNLQAFVCLIIYDMFLVADWLLQPARFGEALLLRLGIVTPLIILLYWVWKQPRMRPHRSPILALASVICYASLLVLYWQASSTAVLELELGLLLIPLTVNTVLRVGLPHAIAASAICYGMQEFFLVGNSNIARDTFWTVSGMVAWSTVLTLMANYALGREQRMSYLLQLRGRIQQTMLEDANRELTSLSTTDRLTGIPNRRAYDARLLKMWKDAIQRREPLAVIMVDVDRFKQLNDTHGHPYGDKILHRVASLLQQALRGERDFVARYGGEEFVVLLPNADQHAAMTVAERMRLLVQVAGSPALKRGSPSDFPTQWATVSCGVASTMPSENADPAAVVAHADKALYQAKQQGRNRVCCH